jgi:hypothetical protein
MVNDFIGGSLKDSKTKLTLGGSFLSKYQADQSSQFNLPENVAAYSGWVLLRHLKISFNVEYAYKINDPSADNGFIFKEGQAFYAETSYSRKGFGITLSIGILTSMFTAVVGTRTVVNAVWGGKRLDKISI